MSESKERKKPTKKKRAIDDDKKKKNAKRNGRDKSSASSSSKKPYTPAIAMPVAHPPSGKDNPVGAIRKRILDIEDEYYSQGDGSGAVNDLFPVLIKADGAGWVDIDMDYLMSLHRFFKTSAETRLVTDILLSDMFSGYIRFERPGMKMKKRAEEWYARIWSKWGRDVVVDIWIQGFALISFKHHPKYVWEPRNVPILPGMSIKYRRTMLGSSQFAVLQEIDDGKTGGVKRTFFRPDIFVICDEPPLPDGTIVSRSATLLPRSVYLDTLMTFYHDAVDKAVTPTIITERIIKPKDDLELHNGVSAAEFGEIKAKASALKSGTDQSVRMARLKEYADNMHQIGDNIEALRAIERNSDECTAVRIKHRYDLPPNYVLAKPPEPKTPPELQFFIQSFIELVFMIYQIPPAIIVVNNARGRTTESASALRVFRLNMQRYKEKAISYIRDFLHVGFDAVWRADFVAQNSETKEGLFTDDELDDATDVDVTMPGLPEWESLAELHKMGIMVPEAMGRFAWMNFGLSPDDVNKEPTISPLTLLTTGKDLMQAKDIAAEKFKVKQDSVERDKDRKAAAATAKATAAVKRPAAGGGGGGKAKKKAKKG
jgi:hypothetical protein